MLFFNDFADFADNKCVYVFNCGSKGSFMYTKKTSLSANINVLYYTES